MPHHSHTAPGLSRKQWLLSLLLGGLVALVWCAPAQWLAQAVHTLSNQRVQLRQARGTVWDGSAQWVLAAGSGSTEALALPQRLHWRIRPHWDASLTIELQADCCTSQTVALQLKPDGQGVQINLHHLEAVLPAHWLSGLGAPWNTMNLQGRLTLTSQQLQWLWSQGQWHMSGAATLALHQLSCGLSTLQPLGSYVVQLQGGTTPSLVLKTSEGKLQLQGQGHWQDGHFSFQGQAWAELGYENALNNLLGVLGQRSGDKTMLRLG